MTPARIAIASAVLLAIGIAMAAIGTATAVDAAAVVVGGVAVVGLVASAFYAVGLSEDRERERDEARRRRP
jgi:hypothetical protein